MTPLWRPTLDIAEDNSQVLSLKLLPVHCIIMIQAYRDERKHFFSRRNVPKFETKSVTQLGRASYCVFSLQRYRTSRYCEVKSDRNLYLKTSFLAIHLIWFNWIDIMKDILFYSPSSSVSCHQQVNRRAVTRLLVSPQLPGASLTIPFGLASG